MGKMRYIIRVVEFACFVAIGVILSSPNWSNLWLIAPIAGFIGLMVHESRTAVTERHLRVRPQLNLLMKLLSFESELDVQCTYYMPRGKQLLQVFDYIPSGGGGGREFSQEKGIIGKTFSGKRALVENFKDVAEYRTKMVEKYNYTDQEVCERRADRRSYFCYSIVDEKSKVLGLLYFDSRHPGAFTPDRNEADIPDQNDQRMETILRACEIIRSSLL